MFSLSQYEDRLLEWAEFRQSLEKDEYPFQKVVDFYNRIPRCSINTDPWNKKIWPGPWELVYENQYCNFCIILGMCYTLQLTERFKGEVFEIHIAKDNKNSSLHYYLTIQGYVLGFSDGEVLHLNQLPTNLIVQKSFLMDNIQ